MLDRDAQETRVRYRERWLQHGYDPRTLGWNKGLQQVRFAAALEGLRPSEYESVLDVGCGFGDLLSFLRVRGWSGAYRGLDLVPELVDEARRRHGDGGEFLCVDASTGALPGSPMAMAVAIGVFNHRLHEDNMDFVRATLASMWASSAKVVVLDFLSDAADPDRQRDDLFYASPAALLDLARSYSRRVAIHHAYMPFEFQMKVWHDDGFLVEAPAFPPYR